MDLILGLIVIGLFVLTAAWVGFHLLKQLDVSFGDNTSTAVAGFLLVEAIGLLCFIGCNMLSKSSLWFSFLPFMGLLLYQLYRKNKELAIPEIATKDFWAISGLIALQLTVYTYLIWSHLLPVINDEGVIYQDVIYHAGISNAFFDLGYPVKDVQYANGIISYHIFTHFVAAQMTFLTGLATYKVYVLAFTIISVALLSLSLFGFSKVALGDGFTSKRFLIISIVTLFGACLMGLGISDAYFSSFVFSYSYQWQLIVFTLITTYLIKLSGDGIPTFNKKDYLVLMLAVGVAIITKGSSLPLLLSGLGFLLLVKFFNEKKINIKDVGFLALTTFFSVLVYLLFFSSKDGADFSSFIGFNEELIQKTLFYAIAGKLGFNTFSIGMVGLLVSVISFRYYLISALHRPIIAFVSGVFISGIFFFLFYSNNPNYFLFPSIFVTNLLLAVYWFKHQYAINKMHRFLLLTMFLLSLYPLSSLGFGFKKKLAEKTEKYHPINKERLKLYDWIESNTPLEAIIFTPSVYATDDYISDNYYPAAMSRRLFYMGGFRFGNPKYSSTFKERKMLVNEFSLTSVDHFTKLKDNNISYILIEKKGNMQDYDLKNLSTSIESKTIQNYRLLFQNEEGAILACNPS